MVKKLLAGVLTLALAFGAFPLAAQMQAVDEGPAVVQTAETPESASWSFNPAEAQGLPGELQAGGTETGNIWESRLTPRRLEASSPPVRPTPR